MDLSRAVSPMTGLQFYLKRQVPLCNGHVFYPLSPWGLTSVSQAQFWGRRLPGDKGGPADILSVIVSDWNTPCARRTDPPMDPKPGRLCKVDEVKREVWLQLKDGLGSHLEDSDLWQAEQKPRGSDESRGDWLDRVLTAACELDRAAIDHDDPNSLRLYEDHNKGPRPTKECTPLFVHPAGTLVDRPDAQLRIPNLLLAADYVRTYTDLASMEGANEAARRAVLAILWREVPELSEQFPKIWPLDEGAMFDGARALDQFLYTSAKLPHVMDAPETASDLLGGAMGGVAQVGSALFGSRRVGDALASLGLTKGVLPRFSTKLTTGAVSGASQVLGRIPRIAKRP
jgi:15-cis-phytoene desaturase